jgi:hypothetical protein
VIGLTGSQSSSSSSSAAIPFFLVTLRKSEELLSSFLLVVNCFSGRLPFASFVSFRAVVQLSPSVDSL